LAYLKAIKLICNALGCEARASVDVFGEAQNHYSSYCKRHAKVVLARVNQQEEENRSRLNLLSEVNKDERG